MSLSRPADLPNDIQTAFIGGTGVYNVDRDDFTVIREVEPETPWGKPSSPIVIGELGGQKIAFLARHGRAHSILPTHVPSRANICALKWLGVRHIIAFSAVGSLKEEIAPRHFVLPEQIIDRTRFRPSTFFDNGFVAHAGFGDPFCGCLADFIAEALGGMDLTLHRGETLVCMEGPAFSTRAESKLYKSWGAGIINMSVLPEAKLAREAEICYQMICMSTDYDSWREESSAVTAEEIMNVVRDNSAHAQEAIWQILKNLDKLDCPADESMKYAFITPPEARDKQAEEKIKALLPHYFGS